MSKPRWFMRPLGIIAAVALVVAAIVGSSFLFGSSHSASDRASGRQAVEGARGPEADQGTEGEGEEGEGEGNHGHESTVHDPNAGYAGWFYGQRSAPGKHVPAGALAAAAAQTRAIRAQGGVALSGAVWQNLGPAPTNQDAPGYQDPTWSNYGGGIGRASGRVAAMAVDPTNPDVVYEGAADGGVWKSTDGGAHWALISQALGTQSIGAMAIPAKAHSTLYVGTGEANTNSDSYFGDGIYKTTNGGKSWGKIGGTVFDKMTTFQIVTDNKGKMVLAATDRGLYRSLDSGNTWRPVLVPGDPALFQSFVTSVAWTYRPNEMVAAVGFRAGGPTNGLYVSMDSGATWSSIGSPPGFDKQADLGRIALATTPEQPGLIYAAIESATNFNTPGSATVFNGVYKSTQGPSGPWTEVQSAGKMAKNQTSAQTPEHIGPGYQPGIQAWYNLYVSVDPTDPNDLIVGLEEVWNSTDGGKSWQVIGRYWNFCQSNPTGNDWCNSGPTEHMTTHPDQHAAGWGVVNGKPLLYVGSDGGVWSQMGPNWSNDDWTDDNTDQSTNQCYSAAASGDGTVICGLQDNGFVKYTGTPEWPAIAGGDGADGVIDPGNAKDLIGSYVNMNIYESHNGGKTYTTITPGDPAPRFVSPIILDPTDKTHIVTLGQEVWESHAGFDTQHSDWTAIDDLGAPSQGTAGSVRGSNIYVGWCGPCNPANFTGSTPFQSGLVSNIGGWHALAAAGLPNRYITSIVQDPKDKQHIYVTLSGYSRNWIPGGSVGHVFESTDGGTTFTDISGDLPDAPISSAILVKGSLIVGTDTMVFQRAPSGGWQILGQGLPTIVISDLTMIPGSNTLVAATHGQGVWTLDLG